MKIEYISEHNTLISPCPICGESEVVWNNVSETGIYYSWGDEIPCTPFMSTECDVCSSQIHFDTNITKKQLVNWIKTSLKYINRLKERN